jgi:5-methylthioadenosine/S-adenosylhomocysteine deaminase
MIEADLIIRADHVLKMDADLTVVEDGAVAVVEGKVAAAGPARDVLKKYTSGNLLGGPGTVVFPGLVNTHTHSPMVYFRGLADDIPLKQWLEKYIWPAEQKWLSPEFVTDAVELACLEMLKAGITAFNDMYFYGNEIAAASRKMGMRASVGAGIVDFATRTGAGPEDYFSNAESLIRSWKDDELIMPCIAPHSLYACGPDTLKRAKKMSEHFGVPLHIHLSETQWEVEQVKALHDKKPVEYLASVGFLDEAVLAAHCVWVEDEEIEILGKKKVNVSHCMESNLKLASGFAPVATMLAEGIKVTFGTDGAASNNDINLLGEMSTTAKVHKALASDPTVLDARTVLLMATRWGAEALGLGKTSGSIEEGKDADIVIADLKKPHLTPMYDVYSHIVYSMNPADVETVIIKGRVVLLNRNLTTADESEIIGKGVEWGERIKGHNRS